MSKSNNDLYVTSECTALYPSLLEPSAYRSERPSYSVTLLFDEEEKARIHAALRTAYEDGAHVLADAMGTVPPFEALHLPVHDSALEKPGMSAYSEPFYLKAKSYYAPSVFGPNNEKLTDARSLYSGMKCRAAIVFKAYRSGPNIGISAFLQHFKKTGEGERITGRPTASAIFGDDAYAADLPF